jgi:hypothetical protein
MMTFLLACLFWAVVSMGVCATIAHVKNRHVGEAIALGGLLGVIGVIIVACWRSIPVGLPPAGWYPCTDGQRYWDGRQWSTLPPRQVL